MKVPDACRGYTFWIVVLVAVTVTGGVPFLVLRGGEAPGDECGRLERAPAVRPDFSGITVPPNIAPLNLLIEEDGSRFFVKIHSAQGEAIEVSSRTGEIIIPRGPWGRLLDGNRGQELCLDVFVKDREGRWNRFETITNSIAREDIDGFVAYRKMHPTRGSWKMTINYRDLSGYDESEILRFDAGFGGGCANCHTPQSNSPDRMLIGVRSTHYGAATLLIEKGGVRKIGTKFGYTAWHPSGRLAAYSVNDLPIFLHSARRVIRDTTDRDSYIAYYLVDEKISKTCPQLSWKERLENWPVWSPDGRYLYYCAAPKLWTDPAEQPPKQYREVKYDLERIRYDVDADEWGEQEDVLASFVTGKSIGMPRISPDGRWLSFCMFDHGFFPNWQEESDLYLIDLEAAEKSGKYEYRKMELNSDRSESWHSWSLNGRWMVFSSKRGHGIFTRLYFSYIDDTGRAHKPFVLPQRDPAFYDSCLFAFNTAEFITGPVPFGKADLERVMRASDTIPVDATTMPTPRAGTPRPPQEWE